MDAERNARDESVVFGCSRFPWSPALQLLRCLESWSRTLFWRSNLRITVPGFPSIINLQNLIIKAYVLRIKHHKNLERVFRSASVKMIPLTPALRFTPGHDELNPSNLESRILWTTDDWWIITDDWLGHSTLRSHPAKWRVMWWLMIKL